MKNRTVQWLYEVPGKKKRYILLLALVQALQGASGVFYALFLRNIVDAAAKGDLSSFLMSVLAIFLCVVIQLGLSAVIRFLTEFSKASFENLFKERLMEAMIKKDYLKVSSIHSGEWMNRATNDTVLVANGYVEIIPGLTGMVVKLISALLMIMALDPRFFAIIVPCGLLLVFFTWLFRKVLKRLHKEVQKEDGRVRIFLQESIGSMLMIHSFAAEQQTMRETVRKLDAHKAARMRKNRFSNLCNIGFGAAMNGMYLLAVGWCGYGMLKGSISFGTLTAITQLISQIQAPFANISGYLPRFFAMQASAERLMEAEEYADDLSDTLSVGDTEAFYERLSSFGIERADFAYYPAAQDLAGLSKEDTEAAVRNFTLKIQKGEYLAFTGRSGCGKSTVLKLLMCVYRLDAGERYYLDNTGKRGDLTSMHRRLFAYVPQGNVLMSGTIREVVAFARPDISCNDKKVWEALKLACADGFVKELDSGLETLLGERGSGLSEGQMQRIAIARAIFSGSPILLLDEATSALDETTEKQLLENLRNLTDKTVITVTHRPAVLSVCDRVLRFTKGAVEEAGEGGVTGGSVDMDI